MLSITSFAARNEVCHFRESVNDYHDKIHMLSCLRKAQNKIHTNVFPYMSRNRKWCIESRVLSMSFGVLTNGTTLDETGNVAAHVRPIEPIFQESNSLITPGVSNKTTGVKFTDKKFPKQGLQDA